MLKKYYFYLIIFLAAILRLATVLQYGNFWSDEMFSFVYSLKPWWPSLTQYWIWETNPPLHTIILKLWFYIFPANEFCSRLPSLSFGVGSVAVLYIFAKKYFTEKIARLSAMIFSLSSIHLFFSATNRVYSLLTLLSLLSVWLTFQIFYEKNYTKKLLASLLIVQTLLFYSHLTWPILIIAESLLIIFWGNQNFKRWCQINFLSGLLFLPWFIPATLHKLLNPKITQAWFFNIKNTGWEKLHQLQLLFTGPTGDWYAIIFLSLFFIGLAIFFYRHRQKDLIIKQKNFIFCLILIFLPLTLALTLNIFFLKFIWLTLPFIILSMAILADYYFKILAIPTMIILMLPGIYNLWHNTLPYNNWDALNQYMCPRYEIQKKQVLIYNNFTTKNEIDRYYHCPIPAVPFIPDEGLKNWDRYLIDNNYVSTFYDEKYIADWLESRGYNKYDQIFLIDGIYHHRDVEKVLKTNGWKLQGTPFTLPILEKPTVLLYQK